MEERSEVHNQVKKPLSEVIIDHHVHEDELEYLKTLGYGELAQGILDNLPIKDVVKTGNFGEVISSEHLRQRYGYEMPILKLRYMDIPDMPMRGEDIIAFKMDDNSIKTICVGEAKTLANYHSSKVKEAHKKLLDEYYLTPSSLSLITTILWSENPELAKKIKNLMANLGFKDFPRHNWIFIITGDKPKDPFKPINDLEDIVNNLYTVSIFVNDLSALIEEVYEMCIK
jgi:hypothetical protein